MGFTARFGYEHDDASRAKYLPVAGLFVGAPAAMANLDEPYRQWEAPLLVQDNNDCVQNAVNSRMRARIVMQRPPEQRSEPLPALPGRRWGYWQYLNNVGKLGLDPGTQPWDYIDLLNEVGWCSEEWISYRTEDGEPIPVDDSHRPPPEAFRHAYAQRGLLRAHQAEDRFDLSRQIRQALRADLGVAIPFACDNRIVAQGGIPADPDFVWNFDPSSGVAGWHMIQVDSFDPVKGLGCPNTWGPGFGFEGRVNIGWDTVLDPSRCRPPIFLDWVPQTSEEIAAAFAATSRP